MALINEQSRSRRIACRQYPSGQLRQATGFAFSSSWAGPKFRKRPGKNQAVREEVCLRGHVEGLGLDLSVRF